MIGFENITTRIEQINSLAYALEGAIIEAAGHDEGERETKQMHNLFYVLLSELEQLAKDADALDGHIAVCNAVFAVNHVDQLKEELEALKSGEGQSE